MSWELLIVAMMAAGGAFLSFLSGFGLGTLLLPALMLFFPPELAVAASAVVHMANNVFKLFLVGKHAQWKIVLLFGFFSVIGAYFGAGLLRWLSADVVLFEYTIGSQQFQSTLAKAVIAVVIGVFAYLESNNRLSGLKLGEGAMLTGGLVSGFFGGLTGHQGALRSAFLMKAGMTKEAFVGTRVVIACMVDLTRLSVYYFMLQQSWDIVTSPAVIVATLAAFTGAFLGNRWMKKKELEAVNRFIQIALMVFAVCLGLGLV